MLIKTLSSMLRRTAGILLLAGAGLEPALASIVSVSALPGSVAVGGSVAIRFDISALGTDSLSLFAFQVHYDAAVLGFSSSSFIDPTSGRNELDLPEAASFGFSGGVTDLGGGDLDVFGLSGNSAATLDADQANAFRFLTLMFDALAPASASAIVLDVGSSQFGDALAEPLDVAMRSSRALVEVTGSGPVGLPEPGALWLALLALGAAGVARRHRRIAGAAAAALLIGGSALAQQAPAKAAPVAASQVDAVVIKAQGMRLQLRSADGREFWVTTKSAVSSDMVGKRVTGQASARGDTQMLANPVYTTKAQ